MFRPFLVLAALLGPMTALGAAADRPSAPRLLPKETLAYIRIEDVNELRESFRDSGIGRMFNDENLKPLVGDAYLAAEELFAEASQFLGVSLDELLSIPQGEVAFAVVPMGDEPEAKADGPKDDSPEAIRARIEARRNRQPVGFVGLIDTAANAGYMRSIIDRLEQQAGNSQVKRTVKTVSGTDVTSYQNPGQPNSPTVSLAERDNVFMIGVGSELVDDMLRRWDGDSKQETLAQNTDFGNVMSHCVGAEATRPQITFYADPYHLVERLVKANGGVAGVVWPILESLQIDKIQGIGGSTFSGGENEFEGIIHLHMLLESPRDGMFAVIRPGEGSTQPESWVPDDVVSYTTLHWDLLKTYEGVGRIIARFQSADAMERLVEEPFKERTDIDLRKDVLEQLTGRISIVRWNEPPMRINSSTQVWAVETKDIGKAEVTMEKLATTFNNALKKELYSGTTLYVAGGPENGNLPQNFRRPTPTVAIIDNYIVGSDSRQAIEHLIQTKNGVGRRLIESPDYDLIAGEISGKLDAEKPFLFSFQRNEEVFRQFFEMAKDPGNREILRNAGENNRFAKLLLDVLEKNELPAFSAFSKYFAPSGGFAYDDPTGLHYATFNLKPME
jgi:hypothetical protein